MEKDYSHIQATTELGLIRERDHRRTLELVNSALSEDDDQNVSYRTLTQEERDIFITSGNADIQPLIGGRPWMRECYLLGNLAYTASRRGTALGYASFSFLNNGDALIVQVQGRKGYNFTPDKRRQLVDTVADFAARIGTERLLLVTGNIVNQVREIPVPRLVEVYQVIAKENGFTEVIHGIPYKQLA